MFSHIEYMEMPGGALGLEPVVVIDPMGYMIIAIALLIIVAIAMYKKLKVYNEIIAEQQDLIDFYYNEDQYK